LHQIFIIAGNKISVDLVFSFVFRTEFEKKNKKYKFVLNSQIPKAQSHAVCESDESRRKREIKLGKRRLFVEETAAAAELEAAMDMPVASTAAAAEVEKQVRRYIYIH
jgi:hypothetical protein